MLRPQLGRSRAQGYAVKVDTNLPQARCVLESVAAVAERAVAEDARIGSAPAGATTNELQNAGGARTYPLDQR
jgi:hypothetical protein